MELRSIRNRNLLNRSKSLLAGYLVSGYPTFGQFLDVGANCVKAGLDIFEIGYPSSHPYLDGDIIQQAHLQTQMNRNDLSNWAKIRETLDCPIWIMGYKEDLLKNDFYLEIAKNRFADGFVLPELTYSERIQFQKSIDPYPIDVIGFINPKMPIESVQEQIEHFNPIYFQLYSGPTGMNGVEEDYKPLLDLIKKNGGCHIFAGFGINTPEKASNLIAAGFDGVIVGTAMVRKLNLSANELYAFIREIKTNLSGKDE